MSDRLTFCLSNKGLRFDCSFILGFSDLHYTSNKSFLSRTESGKLSRSCAIVEKNFFDASTCLVYCHCRETECESSIIANPRCKSSHADATALSFVPATGIAIRSIPVRVGLLLLFLEPALYLLSCYDSEDDGLLFCSQDARLTGKSGKLSSRHRLE